MKVDTSPAPKGRKQEYRKVVKQIHDDYVGDMSVYAEDGAIHVYAPRRTAGCVMHGMISPPPTYWGGHVADMGYHLRFDDADVFLDWMAKPVEERSRKDPGVTNLRGDPNEAERLFFYETEYVNKKGEIDLSKHPDLRSTKYADSRLIRRELKDGSALITYLSGNYNGDEGPRPHHDGPEEIAALGVHRSWMKDWKQPRGSWQKDPRFAYAHSGGCYPHDYSREKTT